MPTYAWKGATHVVVFRAAPASETDPYATEFTDALNQTHLELAIGCLSVTPDELRLGSTVTRGSGTMTQPRNGRGLIKLEPLSFRKNSDDDEFMDYGRYMKFKREFATAGKLWIHRVYEAGTSGDPLARAMYDSDLKVEASADSYWNASADAGDGYPYDPPGVLPLLVVAAEIPEAGRDADMYDPGEWLFRHAAATIRSAS